MTVLSFIAEPMGNAFSRMIEHQADVYGQEVIHGLVADPQRVAVEDFQRLGEMWLENPSPNRLVEWWTYTPSFDEDRSDLRLDMIRVERPTIQQVVRV